MSSRKQELASAVATLKAKNTQGGEPKIGQVGLIDKTIYVGFETTGKAGTMKVVDVNTKRLIGITNLDGNKLDAGRDYIIDGARILFGNDTEPIEAQNWQGGQSCPDPLKNAEIRILQGSKVILDMPITDLIYSSDSNGMTQFRPISTSPLLVSNKEFEIEIEFPNGQTVTSVTKSFARLEFRAHQAKRA
jgi:hypothetical protein